MKNLINSCLIFLLAFSSFGQTKKYLKKNKNAEQYSYSDRPIYARGILCKDGRIFLGNSDGSIYYINIEKKNSAILFKHTGIDEIRDVEAVGNQIIAMHSGENGKLILLKLDGSIKMLKNEEWKGVFFDGIDFYNQTGFLMGDPKDEYFSLFHTKDGGKNWQSCEGKIKAEKGEAGFAASGSNVQVLNDSTYIFVSGGMKSRFFKTTDSGKTWTDAILPYYPGESTGAYSVHFSNDSIGVIVGGDYLDPAIRMNVCFYTFDGGESWFNATAPVRGYRSCVISHNAIFYSCGRNGIDFSFDNGETWIPFANGAYFALCISKDKLVATAKNGKIFFFELIEQ